MDLWLGVSVAEIIVLLVPAVNALRRWREGRRVAQVVNETRQVPPVAADASQAV
jgi:hypothetical protein